MAPAASIFPDRIRFKATTRFRVVSLVVHGLSKKNRSRKTNSDSKFG
jgi:hypothetical protein